MSGLKPRYVLADGQTSLVVWTKHRAKSLFKRLHPPPGESLILARTRRHGVLEILDEKYSP